MRNKRIEFRSFTYHYVDSSVGPINVFQEFKETSEIRIAFQVLVVHCQTVENICEFDIDDWCCQASAVENPVGPATLDPYLVAVAGPNSVSFSWIARR